MRHTGEQAPALTPEIWQTWAGVIKGLYKLSNTGRWEPAVKLSLDARQQFDDSHNTYCDSFDIRPEGDSFEARKVEQAMRIALVLHAIDCPDNPAQHPLSGRTAQTALALATYYGQAARQHQESARQRQDEDSIQRIMATASSYGTETPEGVTVAIREIKRRNSLTQEQLNALALRYPDSIMITTRQPGPEGGRASPVLLIKGNCINSPQ
ncbi:DUF3987 domain-containing protein [Ruficoccus amylovorans]|uniref:DUF3987 domain-containing protein n=1 Tax=Ruficoccus amylovorans TaxID=1804625 RepID=UPI001FEB4D96|nr:DUF3987 domain-containing protein [Ruficoccus amylovorans]